VCRAGLDSRCVDSYGTSRTGNLSTAHADTGIGAVALERSHENARMVLLDHFLADGVCVCPNGCGRDTAVFGLIPAFGTSSLTSSFPPPAQGHVRPW